MSKKTVRFSRLLRIFKLNDRPAYILELEENSQKNLYISYSNPALTRYFESYEKTKLKKEFKDLSESCLMSQCTDATGMFEGSPITHFEADCSSLVCGYLMFYWSKLRLIKTEFPKLKDAESMFCATKIKEFKINLPKLENGDWMFRWSSLKKITSSFPNLENGDWMFGETKVREIKTDFPKLKVGVSMFAKSSLKRIDSQFPNLKHKADMFSETPPELKKNCPQYFV